jgi:hypothetical protein
MVNHSYITDSTERHCRVANTPASYTGGLTKVSRGFSSVPPRKCRDNTLKYGHDPFHSKSFHSSLTCHSFIRRYIASVIEKASLNKLLMK